MTSRNGKTIDIVKRLVVARDLGGGVKDEHIEPEIFKAVKLLRMILRLWIHHNLRHLLKPMKLYNTHTQKEP